MATIQILGAFIQLVQDELGGSGYTLGGESDLNGMWHNSEDEEPSNLILSFLKLYTRKARALDVLSRVLVT